MNDQLNPVFLLQNISESEYWDAESPALKETIVEAEQQLKHNLPEDYKNFLLFADGGSLAGRNNVISLFSIQDVAFFTLDPVEKLGRNLPEMVVIGNDNGNCIYYFDPINYLGKGCCNRVSAS